jgi:hypothetical protein
MLSKVSVVVDVGNGSRGTMARESTMDKKKKFKGFPTFFII